MNISGKVFNLLLSLFILFTSLTSFGQVLNQDSLLAHRAMDTAYTCFYNDNFDSLEYHARRAMLYGEKIENWDIYSNASTKLAKSYWKTGRYKECIELLEKIKPVIVKHYEPNAVIRVGFNYQLAKVYSLDIEKKDIVIDMLKKNISIKKKGPVNSENWQKLFNTPPATPEKKLPGSIAESYRILGSIFGDHHEYDSAIYYMEIANHYFEQSLNNYPKSNASYVANIQYLAHCYQQNQDYESSQNSIHKSRNFIDQNPHLTLDQREYFELVHHRVIGFHYASSHEYELAIEHLHKTSGHPSVYRVLGEVYKNLRNWEQAITYLKQAHYVAEHISGSRPSDIAKIFNQLGSVYFEQEEYDKSLDYFHQAIDIQKKENHETKENRYESFMGMGDIYTELEEYEKASKSYQKAKVEIIDYPFERDVYLSRLSTRIGILAKLKKQYNEAFNHFQKSLNLLGTDVSLENWEDLPDSYSTNYPDDFFFALKSKVETLDKLFKETDNIKYLESELKHYEYLTGFTENIRKHEFKNISKTYWTEKANKISLDYIQTILDYAKITNQPKYSQKAFSIADQNKAGILREALREIDAKSYSHIPEEIIAKEKQIKNEIVWLEKKAFTRKGKLSKIDRKLDLKIQGWENKISELRISQQQLKREISQKYPSYFQAKYDLAPVQLSKAQESLQKSNETLIEYAIADSIIYAFIITKDSYKVYSLSKSDSLEQWIIDLREGIYSHWVSNEKSVSSYKHSVQTYTKAAIKLYSTLLKPIFKNQVLPEKLIIIPDGVLGYIPFEVLLKESPNRMGAFGSYPFLVRETEVSYAFSVQLQLEMHQKKISPTISKILAVAPTFNQAEVLFSSTDQPRQNRLFPLKYNTEEVSYLLKNFDAQMKTNELATKAQFLKLAPYFRIIHLATHAKVHDKNPKFSYIAFTEMTDSLPLANLLYLSEIYNLTLNAEMVVLSACETGIGELQKGEGIISMARAFAYAGSKSIITSLWSVDDRSTADIMKNFYSHLDHGERKSQALRNAKLDYIENHDDLANHPFFWAPMITMGDMSEVELNQKNNTLVWCLGIGFSFLLVIGFRYQRKNSITI